MAAPHRVLVVDDEPTVREVVAAYLEREGYLVSEAANGRTALELLERSPPDLVVLDLMLPAVRGLDVLRRVRETGRIPVILLTALSDEPDRVLGLELGADDYVTKPFSPRELVARVRSVLRRAQPDLPETDGEVLVFDGLVVDRRAREVHLGDMAIALTPKEFDLLAFLASAPRQVFSRAQLLEHVWDSSADYQDPATVTVHIGRLRAKVEANPDEPRWIATVWGVGYRFQP